MNAFVSAWAIQRKGNAFASTVNRANTKLFQQNGEAMPKGNPGKQQAEPEERIYKYIEEINKDPVVYHWTYKMDETFI